MARSTQPDPRAYVRLASLLRAQIINRTLPPGTPLPSITTLCREHGFSRTTASKAMRMLESEELVSRVPGLGYYVTHLPPRPALC